MLDYKEVKKRIKDAGESTRYFTEKFYHTFIQDYRLAVQSVMHNADYETYVSTKETDFYIKNSGAYCIFQEIFYDALPKFRVTFCVDAFGNGEMNRYIHAEDEWTARKMAEGLLKSGKYDGFRFFEILKVA